MSRKRVHSASSSSSGTSSDHYFTPKRRPVQRKTVEKWIAENDRELSTSVWLKFEMADREHVSLLKCSVCSLFSKKLESMRNFRPAFITGTPNIRVSNVKDHAVTDMHSHAMLLLKKQQSSNVEDYSPIARSFAQSSMDEVTLDQTKKKFDITYMIAKEKMAFTKMKSLCELEERHGVKLGTGYKNDHACARFTEFIAREQQEILQIALKKANFFSIQGDASTDAGNVELELFLVLYFDASSKDGTIHVRSKFFTTRHLSSGTGEGLFESLKKGLAYMSIDDWKSKMIGFGCDGASANLADGGLKGLLKEELPWIVVSWCLAHRLELSVKDALKSTFFSTIDELLMRMYYIYEKSPKKCRALETIVEELKVCLEPSDMSRKGGSRPLRACGTRFISHKIAALERMIGKFGAYLAHLIAMTEDSSFQPADRQKMKGYVLRWQNSDILLGCAVFKDILKPASILSKVLQGEEVCVVRAIEATFKSKKLLDKLKSTVFEELPTVKAVLEQIERRDGTVTYQGVDLKKYDQSIDRLKSQMSEWIAALETCLQKRTASNEIELLTHAVTLLATNGWERNPSPSFGYKALEVVCQRFRTPLGNAGVDCSVVQDEWDDMVDYGKKFLNLVQDDYKVNWWKLFNAVDANNWSNVLKVIELLFCLPTSNGKLERIFSQVKLIKTEKRTCLQESTLDQLIRINVEGPPLSEWDSSSAVGLWLKDRSRRVNRREPHSTTASTSHSASQSSSSNTVTDKDSDESTFNLDDWEEWILDD